MPSPALPSAPLRAADLVRILGGRRVLDGVSLRASPGQRIGVIGENGAGKSTLLRLLAGIDQPDAGSIARPADLGFLHQEMPVDPAATIADVLDDALREARRDLAELDRIAEQLADPPADARDDEARRQQLLASYGEWLERAADHGAWDADRRAALALDGLGLGGIAQDRPVGSISGGQRGRLALAALLIRRPTALLLDEPTNHLDDDAAAFLEDQLRALPGAVVLASHDRAFLDATCTELIDLDPAPGGPTRHGGGYVEYLAAKQATRVRWAEQFDREQQELRALRHAAATTAHHVAHGRPARDNEKMNYGRTAGRVEAQISRRVRNAARRLEDLERAQVRKPPDPLRFRPPTRAIASPDDQEPLLAARQIHVPGRVRLDRLDIAANDRLLIVGPNGAGKSTLLAVLAGALAGHGQVRRRPGLRIGLLAQDTTFAQPRLSAARTFALAVGAELADAVPLRSLGLLAARDHATAVADLSAGQRRRLALAILFADPPDLLLLDEPTNHLSPALADELEEALVDGPGAVAIASHDRWLRSRWRGRVLRLD